MNNPSNSSVHFPSPCDALIILSGGMDSGVMLSDSLNRGFSIKTLSFDYSAKHSARELQHSKLLCEHFGIERRVIDLGFINEHFSSSLLSSGDALPLGSYSTHNMASTVVPFRNGIMLSIAAGLAESLEIPLVMIGTHGGDHPVYPDCRPDFNQAMAEAVSLGSGGKVSFAAPYQNISKAEIAAIGASLAFPFELTWTCYSGGEHHCKQCAACIERMSALESIDNSNIKLSNHKSL